MSGHQKKLRCAVYTRKSTEEGLDQEFNSLDAQREACAAFVASQAGLGWRLIDNHYDDGGISCGTMERPALKRLLQDIRDRKVDVVVVYKIDRLTRSLMDFSKIVEVFDANEVSFVSVTQQFNTTTSMGRLTLNVLLSFAQFEREVTAERVRDKIAASRKKGIWMGGTVPLGYRAVDRKLVVEPEAANMVRMIFRRYLELKSVPALADELNADLVARQDGSPSGSPHQAPYTRGKLYHLLSNPVYIGKARHKELIYDGEHEAIISDETYAVATALLKDQAPSRTNGSTTQSRHLLTGLLFDETGDRLSPAFTVKGGKRYRYYISNRLETAGKDPSGWRLPAVELETTVLHQLDVMLQDEVMMSDWVGMLAPTIPAQTAIAEAKALREQLRTTTPEQGKALKRLVRSICVKPGAMAFEINPRAALGANGNGDNQIARSSGNSITISVPMSLRRRGCEARLVLDGQQAVRKPDDGLVDTLAKAHIMLGMLTDGSGRTIADLANEVGIHVADVSRILPLAFLAPKIADAILRGRQPVELTARTMMRDELPIDWAEQLQQFRV
ncbi:recombinase family protein [Mesorhizobium marinum]|uniref:recombinase family protein n=1 Tax=Mesorhizobium marinum TaxID=3228790 RepID=UPI0034651AEB